MTRSHKASCPRKRAPAVRPIDPRIDIALDAMARAVVKGETPLTITRAAEIARMRRESLSVALKRGVVAARAIEKVRELIGTRGVMRAGSTLVEMLDSGSDYVRLEAALKTLGIVGIKPADSERPVSAGGLNVTVVLKHERGDLTSPRGVTAPLIEARPTPVYPTEGRRDE